MPDHVPLHPALRPHRMKDEHRPFASPDVMVIDPKAQDGSLPRYSLGEKEPSGQCQQSLSGLKGTFALILAGINYKSVDLS